MVTIDCICPGDHEHDTVTLRETLDFRTALTMQKAVTVIKSEDPDASTEEVLAALDEAYVLHGIKSWSLVDPDGKPLPVNRNTITEYLLADIGAAMAVADAAGDLYSRVVLLPLLGRGSTSSSDTPTEPSTSAQIGSEPEPPKPLRRSSTTSSPTVVTVTTSSSPDGDSNSSQSSVSAA